MMRSIIIVAILIHCVACNRDSRKIESGAPEKGAGVSPPTETSRAVNRPPEIAGVDLSKYTMLAPHTQGQIYYQEKTEGAFFEPGFVSQLRIVDVREKNNVHYIHFETTVVSPNIYSIVAMLPEQFSASDSGFTITYEVCPDGDDHCDVHSFVYK